jgi:hypothetical protein
MSAAATAAGYLYASGRLRGRGAREQDEKHSNEKAAPQPREEIRVAVLPQEDRFRDDRPREERPRKIPKVEYRTRRRWSAA